MPLKRLAVNALRNLNTVDINLSDRVNLFYGLNGSGKTSILEAVSVLGLGRSFRSHKLKPLINTDQDRLTVFGLLQEQGGSESPVGVMRTRSGESLFKFDGKPVSSASVLAEQLPVQVLNAQSFQLLEGSSKIRRQFVDWLVFHVEPAFLAAWKDLQRCLKQRNSLLRRDRISAAELRPWDQELCTLAAKIDPYRAKRVEQFLEVFQGLVAEFIKVENLQIKYYRGWDKDKALSDVLDESIERDAKRGYTGLGPHRADLKITVGGQMAVDILSRGQQKLLICALRIAQGYVFAQQTGRACVYLVDDLPSELDVEFQSLMARWLYTMGCQVLITGVERNALEEVWEQFEDIDPRVFHVKQGSVHTAL